MTNKHFLIAVSNGKADILQTLLDILKKTKCPYCVIGGLAVNAYVEPVVSLDLDLVVAVDDLDKVCKTAEALGLKVARFEHSVNLSSRVSDLRIQLQRDSRYQEFIARSVSRKVLGYGMKVARLEDVLQGKLWAWSDQQRRGSKRQKDLADIMRLVESYPEMESRLPAVIRKQLH